MIRFIVGIALIVCFEVTAVMSAAGLVQVQVDGGTVSGTAGLKPGVRVFKGIPFAAPPVGPLRWRPPQPVSHWSGVRDGSHFAAICPQKTDDLDSIYYLDPGKQTLSEDCLYLNVWTAAPSASARLPVMVWLYGGGFDHGSGTEKYYWGDDLAKKGAVVVTFNYRVGALGFLAHPELTKESGRNASGNYAFMDQIAALQWVKRNIAAFGGDPSRVTLFGQSAGGASVGYLMASPFAKGLFQRAIGESGGIGQGGVKTLAAAEKAGEKYAHALGATTLADLRAKTVEQLRSVPGSFRPITDGYVVPADPYEIFEAGKQNDVPLLAGSTANEGGARRADGSAHDFAHEARAAYGADAEAYLKLYPAESDSQAEESRYATMADRTAAGQRMWAQLETRTGTHKAYLYLFSRIPPFPPGAHFREARTSKLGAYHAVELIYVFDHPYLKDWPWQDQDRKIADDMSSYWANFAATGDPNGGGLPNWPAYNEKNEKRMNFGDQIAAGPIPNQAALDFIAAHPATQARGGSR